MFDAGAFAEARMLFSQLLKGAETMSDRRTAAGFKINLAATEVELKLYDSATALLMEALQTCTELQLHVNVIHARWILATVPLRAGRPEDAEQPLARLVDECREAGMTGTASGVALDLAEAYALMGRAADVARLCSTLIADFVAKGQLTSAMTAFAFLRDEGANGAVAADHVRHVKRFMADLSRRPNLRFEPPRG